MTDDLDGTERDLHADLALHVANPDERAQAFANVYEVWPAGPNPEEHLRRRLANPKYETATWYVGTLAGRVVAACGCYHVSVRIDGVVERACAIGAVHTLPEFRGRGFAPRVLAFAEGDQRAAGKTLSLLYSDIGAPYYARLGYRPCVASQGSVTPAESKVECPGAYDFRQFAPADSLSILIDLYDRAHQRYPLSIARSSDYWRYLLTQNPEDEFYFLIQGKPLGYVRLAIRQHGIVIRDVSLLDDDDETQRDLYSAVIALAQARGAERVGGWMAADAVCRELFQVSDRVQELTMIKPLVDRIKVDERHCEAARHFHEIDHV
jgi:predicted acetyltransferase